MVPDLHIRPFGETQSHMQWLVEGCNSTILNKPPASMALKRLLALWDRTETAEDTPEQGSKTKR
jgi:hypothetical protein